MNSQLKVKFGGSAVLALASILSVTLLVGEQQQLEPEMLALEDYIQRVLDHNDRIQISVLQTEIGKRRLDAERTLYNPELVLNTQYQNLDRPNTIQEERSLSGLSEFDQQTQLYSSGIESMIPGGGRVRLGYSISRLKNNLQGTASIFGTARPAGSEYVTFTGGFQWFSHC